MPPQQPEQNNQANQNQQNTPVTPPAQTPEGVINSNSTQVAPPKNNKRLAIIIIAIVAVLLLLGGSAAAYFFAYLPNKPENVLMQALYNTATRSEVKSGKIAGTLKVSGKDIPEKLGDIDISASFSDSDKFDASISTDIDGNTITGEIISLGKDDNYVKVNGLTNVDKIIKTLNLDDKDSQQALVLVAPILQKLDDQWIKFDQAADQATGGSSSALDALDLSDEDADKVAEIYQNHPVIEITEVKQDEEVNGETSKHFVAKINKDNYVAFLSELKDANINGLKVEQSEIESAKDEDFSKLNIEIWVKKDDKTVNQVMLSGESDGVNVELRLSLTSVNQAINIEAPEGAKTFEEIFNEVLGSGGSTVSPLLSAPSGT